MSVKRPRIKPIPLLEGVSAKDSEGQHSPSEGEVSSDTNSFAPPLDRSPGFAPAVLDASLETLPASLAGDRVKLSDPSESTDLQLKEKGGALPPAVEADIPIPGSLGKYLQGIRGGIQEEFTKLWDIVPSIKESAFLSEEDEDMFLSSTPIPYDHYVGSSPAPFYFTTDTSHFDQREESDASTPTEQNLPDELGLSESDSSLSDSAVARAGPFAWRTARGNLVLLEAMDTIIDGSTPSGTLTDMRTRVEKVDERFEYLQTIRKAKRELWEKLAAWHEVSQDLKKHTRQYEWLNFCVIAAIGILLAVLTFLDFYTLEYSLLNFSFYVLFLVLFPVVLDHLPRAWFTRVAHFLGKSRSFFKRGTSAVHRPLPHREQLDMVTPKRKL